MRKNKIVSIFVGIISLIAILTVCLTGCNKYKYFEEISQYTFWENEGKQAIAQTKIYDMVMEHMNTENGKEKKVLVLGFDGTRADALVNIRNSGVLDKNGNDIYSGDNPNASVSAINHIVDYMGGKMYISYAGGSNEDNFQAASTAPGWASITTGCWGTENGVRDNPIIDEENSANDQNIKNMEKKTFMLQLAEKGYRSAFAATWSAHRHTYRNEMNYVKENALPFEYYGFGELDENGEVVEYSDNDLHKKLLSYVTAGSENEKDIIFAIYDWADHNGHATGFTNKNRNYVNAVRNNDALMYEVIKTVESRSNYLNEDWLIVLTADHGGYKTWHGVQKAECRTTFIVTNKHNLVKTEYYSKNYDGFKEN